MYTSSTYLKPYPSSILLVIQNFMNAGSLLLKPITKHVHAIHVCQGSRQKFTPERFQHYVTFSKITNKISLISRTRPSLTDNQSAGKTHRRHRQLESRLFGRFRLKRNCPGTGPIVSSRCQGRCFEGQLGPYVPLALPPRSSTSVAWRLHQTHTI